MILVIRGHIRKAFETAKLYNFILNLYHIDKSLSIYIHTWNVFANNISWRDIELNNSFVSEELIYDYFNELKHLIKHIIIDNDKEIQLIGNLNGNVCNSKMPIIGWKNYWYGKYNIINYIFNKNIAYNEMIINTRFDVLDNSFSFCEDELIRFIENHKGMLISKNHFIHDKEFCGMDNIYIGNINTMYKLTHHFFSDLDHMMNLSINKNIIHQEFLIYRINKYLFSS